MQELRTALRHILDSFQDYIARSYTSYFYDFSMMEPYHLGQMLQCAAILDTICCKRLDVERSVLSDKGASGPAYPADTYIDLLNWSGELVPYRLEEEGGMS